MAWLTTGEVEQEVTEELPPEEAYVLPEAQAVTFDGEPWSEGMTENWKENLTPEELAEMEGNTGADGAAAWGQTGYTDGLPRPPGTLTYDGEDNGTYTAACTDVTREAFDAYVLSAREAGFTLEAAEEDLAAYGMVSFTAVHTDGRWLSLTWMSGSLTLEITR